MDELFKVTKLNYEDRIGNLRSEAHGKVKSMKYFPIYEIDNRKMIFKPLSKTKPLLTPFFAYSEVYWSDIIKNYFDEKAPQYSLAISKGIEENAPKIEKNQEKLNTQCMMLEYGGFIKKWKKLKESSYNQILDSVNKLYIVDESLVTEVNESVKNKTSLEEDMINTIFLQDYYEALANLNPIQKQIMLLYYDENGKRGYSTQEISDTLGIDKKTIYQEKRKAINKLRNNPVILSYNID